MLHCSQCRALNLESDPSCVICGAILDEGNVGPLSPTGASATAGVVPSQLALGIAGVIVLAAGIAGGLWTADHEGIDFAITTGSLTYFVADTDVGFWSFLLPATFPMAVSMFLLVKAGGMGGGALAQRLWPYGFLAGMVVVVAGFASGAFAASEANDAQFWIFLLVASSPVGLGVAVMITALNQREGILWPGTATSGIVTGLVLVAAAFVLGIKIATDVSYDHFWAFLLFALVPLGIGFLVLISAQALREGEHPGGGLIMQLIGLAVIIGGAAVGGYLAKETAPHNLLMFLLFATTPMGIGLLIALSSGDLTRSGGWRLSPTLGMVSGALVAVAGVVGGFWWSFEIEESRFWVTLLIATPQVGIGLLCVVDAQRARIILPEDEPVDAMDQSENDLQPEGLDDAPNFNS